MRTQHGFERLVFFSDAVVAIAITLLILPLVESVAEFDGEFGAFIAEHAVQLFVFVLSFAVIGNFWIVHHRMYEKVAGYTPGLLWANLLWLMSIVFLPFPTALLATTDADDTGVHALYIGTMLVTAAAGLLQQWLIKRDPALQAEAARGTIRLLPYLTTTAIMVVALVIAVTLPTIGLWSLLLLLVATPIEKLIYRRRKARV